VHNPLLRAEMLGTGWFGCIFELEGVLVKSRAAEHKMSWLRLAEERGEPTPPEMVGRCSLNLVRPRVDRALLPR